MIKKDEMLKKLKNCVESGVETDKEGHAELRMRQRNIKFDTVKNALRSYDKIESIKEYKPRDRKNAYRVFIAEAGILRGLDPQMRARLFLKAHP